MHLGWAEIAVVAVFALIIFGPDKLPELGKTIGNVLGQFNKAKAKMNDTLKKEGLDKDSINEVKTNPFLALDKLAAISDKVENIDEISDGINESIGGLIDAAVGEENAEDAGSTVLPSANAKKPKARPAPPKVSLKTASTSEKIEPEPEAGVASEDAPVSGPKTNKVDSSSKSKGEKTIPASDFSLSAMTVAQLKEYAAIAQISLKGITRKADIIAAIENAQSVGEEEGRG